MHVEHIDTQPVFDRRYRKLPKRIKDAAKAREQIFRVNPYDSVLKTHKLHGREKGAWAFSINQKYRIKFIFLTERSVLFLDIGTHDIYD